MIALMINPEMEAYFVGVALAHGTNPLPRYGLERTQLAQELADFMKGHSGETNLMNKLRRNFAELGGRLLDTDPTWFYTRLADAYLDWLYGQNVGRGAEHPDEAARKDSASDHGLAELAKTPWRDWKL